MGKVLVSGNSVMQHLGKLAAANNWDQILFHATDFLMFVSQMVVAWRLADNAVVAAEKLKNSNNTAEDIHFLNTKLVDLKTYCGQFLIHNLSIAKTIIDHEQNISTLEF